MNPVYNVHCCKLTLLAPFLQQFHRLRHVLNTENYAKHSLIIDIMLCVLAKLPISRLIENIILKNTRKIKRTDDKNFVPFTILPFQNKYLFLI